MNYPLNLQKNETKIYKYNQANYNSINNYLNSINWYLEFSSSKSVEEEYNCLISHLNLARDKYIPYKILNDNINTNQKIPHHLRKTIIKKRKYWRLARNAANKEGYLQLARKCKIEYAALANYELKKLINNKNTKAYFNLLNKKLGHKIKNCVKISKKDIYKWKR